MFREREDSGFSLVELMVALLIVAVLVSISLPMYVGFQNRAQDRATAQMLTSAAKVEASLSAELDGFNADPAVLAVLEPAIDFSGLTDRSVHLVVADVNPGDQQQMLMYAKSPSGNWLGIRLVNEGGLAGRHTCEDPDVANVSDIALCIGVAW